MNPKMILDDMSLHVKIKISALWVSTMMCYLYADLLAFYQPGSIQKIMEGNLGGWQTTPGFLLVSAAVMAIPSVMIFLTLVLNASASRWFNIIFGVFDTAKALITTVGAFKYHFYFYIFLGSIEVVLLGLIIWYAWTWPKHEVQD